MGFLRGLRGVTLRITLAPETAMAAKKPSIVTFKAEPAMLDALRAVPNRSEFIRAAVLGALEHACPLCGGSGVFTPEQKRHWETFRKHHAMKECGDCHAVHLVCAADRAAPRHRRARA